MRTVRIQACTHSASEVRRAAYGPGGGGRATFADMSDRGYRRPRVLSPLREHLRDTFWFAPTVGLLCSFALWWGVSALDAEIVTHLKDEQAYEEVGDLIRFADDARTIVTTVSSAMMTFIGVVFSISLVAVQMASGQLTPRVVRIFVRSRISKLTLTVFLATFAFSLLVLTSYESESDPLAGHVRTASAEHADAGHGGPQPVAVHRVRQLDAAAHAGGAGRRSHHP